MNERIIYPNEEGGVAVIVPANNTKLTVADIALKDVPAGVKFKVVDVSDIPTDRTFRNAWEFDFTNDFDGEGMGPEAFKAMRGN